MVGPIEQPVARGSFREEARAAVVCCYMRRFLELSTLFLSVLAVWRLVMGDAVEEAREAAVSDLVILRAAVDEFADRNAGRFPDSLEVLRRPDESGGRFLAADAPTRDPWGNLYRYDRPIRGSDARVYSLGADGLRGGRGEDADVLGPGRRDS